MTDVEWEAYMNSLSPQEWDHDYDEYMDEIKGYGITGEQRDRSLKEVVETGK